MSDGYTCKCKHVNKFSAWVYAHWSEVIKGRCEQCSMECTIHRGKVLSFGKSVDRDAVEARAAESLGISQ